MAQWVGVKMAVNLRPALYEAILSLLHKDEDLAVRLQAAQTLKTDILSLKDKSSLMCLLFIIC